MGLTVITGGPSADITAVLYDAVRDAVRDRRSAQLLLPTMPDVRRAQHALAVDCPIGLGDRTARSPRRDRVGPAWGWSSPHHRSRAPRPALERVGTRSPWATTGGGAAPPAERPRPSFRGGGAGQGRSASRGRRRAARASGDRLSRAARRGRAGRARRGRPAACSRHRRSRRARRRPPVHRPRPRAAIGAACLGAIGRSPRVAAVRSRGSGDRGDGRSGGLASRPRGPASGMRGSAGRGHGTRRCREAPVRLRGRRQGGRSDLARCRPGRGGRGASGCRARGTRSDRGCGTRADSGGVHATPLATTPGCAAYSRSTALRPTTMCPFRRGRRRWAGRSCERGRSRPADRSAPTSGRSCAHRTRARRQAWRTRPTHGGARSGHPMGPACSRRYLPRRRGGR